MSNLSKFNRSPVALAGWLLLVAAGGVPTALSAQQLSPTNANQLAAPVTGPKACRSAEDEEGLLKREKTLLGPRHADQHARARANQCEVERGIRKVPAAGVVKGARETLDEDKAAKQKVHKLVTQSRAQGPSSASLVVNMAAGAPPETILGRWSSPFVIPVVGVATVLLHTGNVMFWSYDPVDYHNPKNSKNGVAYIWNPTTRQGRNIPPPENIWCAGQTILSDGRVYIAGGNLRYPDPSLPANQGSWEGTLTNYTFNPYTETWARQPDMSRGRWYPTVTQLSDNRIVVTSGIDETGSNAINNAVEVFTPDPNIDGIGRIRVVSTHDTSGLYPLQFLLPSGQMLEAGPKADSSFVLNPATWSWSNLPRMSSDHYYLGNGISFTNATVAPARQLIMVAGGHNETTALSNNEWLDGNNPAAGWKPYPQWLQPRHNANTVILPDGKLLTVGGNRGLYGYEEPEFSTELYSEPADSTAGTWQAVAPHAIQAAYHSTAILLPDATVLLSQDDMDYSAAAAFQHKAQIYSPPYLFKGPQPIITAAPAMLKLGQSFSVSTDRGGMTSAVLVAPGATTHGNDMHQRAIKLNVQVLANGLNATLPASASLVPPGYYMLFVMDSLGVPSIAKFVQVS